MVDYSDGKDTRLTSKFLYRLSVIISVSIGLLLSIVESFRPYGVDLLGTGTVSLTVAVTFLIVVSFYTDHKYRNVDRVLLRVVILFAIILGSLRMFEIYSEPITVVYIVAILLAFSSMFIPSLGASDSRAYIIVAAISIPFLGLNIAYYVFVAGIVLWLGYGVITAVKNRTLKVSIPMVPYILLPLVLATVVTSLLYGIPNMIEVFKTTSS